MIINCDGGYGLLAAYLNGNLSVVDVVEVGPSLFLLAESPMSVDGFAV